MPPSKSEPMATCSTPAIPHHVLDLQHDVVERHLFRLADEGAVEVHPGNASGLGDGAQLRVAEVARALGEGARGRVRGDDGGAELLREMGAESANTQPER